MAPRWSWDFEDEPRPKPRAEPLAVPPADPPEGAPGPSRREALVRRRRAVALVAALALVALIVAVATSGSHHAGTGHAGMPMHAVVRPPTDPEQDEMGAVRSVLAYTPFVKEGTGTAKEIALTFDDGPGPFTPQVLTVLEQNHV